MLSASKGNGYESQTGDTQISPFAIKPQGSTKKQI